MDIKEALKVIASTLDAAVDCIGDNETENVGVLALIIVDKQPELKLAGDYDFLIAGLALALHTSPELVDLLNESLKILHDYETLANISLDYAN